MKRDMDLLRLMLLRLEALHTKIGTTTSATMTGTFSSRDTTPWLSLSMRGY
jgi:hypothetical protein